MLTWSHKYFRYSIIAILLGVVIYLTYYFFPTQGSELDEKINYVQTAPVVKQRLEEEFTTVATLEAEKIVAISNQIAGQVKQIYRQAGEWVNVGDILVTLEPHAEIRSPISGYLTEWQVKNGQFIGVGTLMTKVVNKQQLYIRYYVPEQMVDKLAIGQSVQVSVTGNEAYTYRGHVEYISPIVEAKNHSILVKAKIDNVDEALTPGRFVYVIHQLKEIPKALVAPRACLLQAIDGYYVYQAIDGKAVRKNVTVGSNAKNADVEILSGLEEGDNCIVVVSPQLHDGASIVAKPWGN